MLQDAQQATGQHAMLQDFPSYQLDLRACLGVTAAGHANVLLLDCPLELACYLSFKTFKQVTEYHYS